MNWAEQVVLVTGGTGSFGKKFVEIMLREYHPKRLVIFSRDELKQHDMRAAGFDHPTLRYFIGDVRDAGRLQRAFSGVTVAGFTSRMNSCGGQRSEESSCASSAKSSGDKIDGVPPPK